MINNSFFKNLKKPVAFFDLETTGTNPENDRVVEISIVKYYPGGTRELYTQRIRPEIAIPQEATNVHGITNEDVKLSPTFAEVSGEILGMLEGCDLAGFNILSFDLPLLIKEMERVGITHFPAKGTRFIDVMKIYHYFEKRDLSAAIRFYLDKEPENAHSAEADALATAEVLQAQLEKYGLNGDIEELEKLSVNGNEMIDYAGKFTRNDKGEIVFAFGTHNGDKVTDHPDYLNWMLTRNFTADTKRIAAQILEGKMS